jgi:hypothetical protein
MAGMTHVLDIGTDLDDLIAIVGDLTPDPQESTISIDDATSRPPLVSPKVTRSAWYQ